MNQITTYQAIDRSNPISDLLDMIARRGPELMRQGGGPLSKEQLWSGRHLDAEERTEIRHLARSGKTDREIAAIVGRSVKTVWMNTKDIARPTVTRRGG